MAGLDDIHLQVPVSPSLPFHILSPNPAGLSDADMPHLTPSRSLQLPASIPPTASIPISVETSSGLPTHLDNIHLVFSGNRDLIGSVGGRGLEVPAPRCLPSIVFVSFLTQGQVARSSSTSLGGPTADHHVSRSRRVRADPIEHSDRSRPSFGKLVTISIGQALRSEQRHAVDAGVLAPGFLPADHPSGTVL